MRLYEKVKHGQIVELLKVKLLTSYLFTEKIVYQTDY